jgi:MFS family permease
MSSRIRQQEPSGAAERPRERQAMLFVLMGSFPLVGMLFTVTSPILPEMIKHLGPHDSAALLGQLIMTAPAIGVIIGGPSAGWLADRHGYRPVMLAALAVYGLCGMVGMLDVPWQTLLLARGIAGAAGAATTLCAQSLIGLRYSDDDRPRVLGRFLAIGSIFNIVFLLASGALAQALGWHASFGLHALAILLLAVAWRVVPAGTGRREARAATDWRPVIGLAPIYGAVLILFLPAMMASIQLSLLLAAKGVGAPAARAAIQSTVSIASALAGLNFGTVLARTGRPYAAGLMLGLLGTGYGVLAVAQTVPLLVFGCGLAGLGVGLLQPYFASLLLQRAPMSFRARSLGLMSAAVFASDLLNPVVLLPLRHAFGLAGMFMAIAISLLIAAAAIIIYKAIDYHRSPKQGMV